MQQIEKGKLLFSPSDLITFLGCHHATFLDLKWLGGEIKPAEDSTSNKLLQDKGYEHEKNYLQSLKDNAKVIFEISKDQPSEARIRQTDPPSKYRTPCLAGIILRMRSCYEKKSLYKRVQAAST